MNSPFGHPRDSFEYAGKGEPRMAGVTEKGPSEQTTPGFDTATVAMSHSAKSGKKAK